MTTSMMRTLEMFGDPALFRVEWPDHPYHHIGAAEKVVAAFPLQTVDALLNSQGMRVPAFRMVCDNTLVPLEQITRADRATTQPGRELVDPARVLHALGNGTTLILQGVHRRTGRLRGIGRRLAAAIGHPVSVNAFLTPPSAQGAGAHHDPQHAWLVQTAGTKRWRLWGPSADPAADSPHLQIDLNQGDVLWIPQGWWHEGASLEYASVHLTFTVLATTTGDIIKDIVDDVMRRHPAVELPPRALNDQSSALRAALDAAGIARTAIGSCDLVEIVERIARLRLNQFDPLPAQPVVTAFAPTRDTIYHTHPEGVLYTVVTARDVQLVTTDARIRCDVDSVEQVQAMINNTDEVSLDEAVAIIDDHKIVDDLIAARLLCESDCRSELR